MGRLGKLWNKFKGVEEIEDNSSSQSGAAEIAVGKPKFTRTVVKVSTHFKVGSQPNTDSGITYSSSSEKHPATGADFTMLLDVFRNALSGAKLNSMARSSIEADLQALKLETEKGAPSRSVIEEKLKSTEAIVKSAGADSNLLQLSGVLLQLAQYLFKG